MILSDTEERIILAALTDLDERLSRGVANCGLGKAAFEILRSPPIHDSYVTSLRQRFESGR